MTWTLLLSKYPRSILTEEQPLLILTVLERAGLATESDLEQMVGDDLPGIRKALLQLQLNNLVEYGANHVRLTESARELLERLALHEEVMNDVLDALAVRGKERSDYRLALESYRKSSFRLYQNSLCTLRQWKSLSEHLPGNVSKGETAPETRAGMRSLLLRDLRNWLVHGGPGNSLLNDMNESFRSLVLFDDVELKQGRPTSDKLRDCTQVFLRAIVATNFDHDLERAAKWHDSGKWVPLFQDFHRFQASWEPDIWFDKWVVEYKHPNPRKYRSLDRYIHGLRDSLRDASREDAEESKSYTLACFFDAWRPAASEAQLTDSFVAHLIIAEDMSELSQRTHLPKQSLRILLESVRDACMRLLSEHSSDQASEVSVGSEQQHE